jgi:[protein-PII] uridylyltransferase
MALNMGEEKLQWELEKLSDAPVTRIVMCTYDKPGLFSKMAGVLSLNDITVLSANIFTLKNRMAFDIYEVTNPLDPYSEKERWAKIHREINLSLEDQFPLEDRIRKKEKAKLNGQRHEKARIRAVRINNDVSDFFTVVEVRSAAILGLLYELTKNLFLLGLDIRFARFDRDKEYMSGDFYIRNSLGQKIFDERQIEEIRASIFGITD